MCQKLFKNLKELDEIWNLIRTEFRISTARSGGKGGQNVNKVETKVVLHWNVPESVALTETQKTKLLARLSLTGEGEVVIHCEETRSQKKNRELAEKRLYDKLLLALKPVRKRKPTRVPKSVKKARQEAKKKQSEKKASRRSIDPGDQ